MGTYYRISFDPSESDQKKMATEIEEILIELNQGLSTYIESSSISRLNREADLVLNLNDPADQYFYSVYKRAKTIYKESEGDFDPTVMPLVNFYGFGYTEKKKLKYLDSLVVRDILKAVSFDFINQFDVNGKTVISKSHNETELDFSAIAKGYAVDILSNNLVKHGLKDFLVDIGGEIYVSGFNSKNQKWGLAINRPLEGASSIEADIVVKLTNAALASSGNYRNFYEVDGVKYSHTINPKTGFPERSILLGASVIAKNCMEADAYATACMVKGLEDSKAFIESLQDIEACLIYNNDGELKTHFSSGFSKYIALAN